jgi:predicted nucleic acid-binding protein
MQKGEDEKDRKAVMLIRNLPNTTIVDLTSDMALNIAELKVAEKLSIADAAVLSAATGMHADAFLTYDADFKNIKVIQCMSPEQ